MANLDKICYAQFCKEYDPHRKAQKKKSEEKNDSSGSDEADGEAIEEKALEADPENVSFYDQIHTGDDEEIYRLPTLIKLTTVNPGEAPYMKRKKVSNSIRFHKIKDKSSHEWLYSQPLLYYPFQQEAVDLKEAIEKKGLRGYVSLSCKS